MTQLQDALQAYGIEPHQVRVLSSDGLQRSAKLEYQDLIGREVNRAPDVDAVVEYDGQPILYILRRNTLSHDQSENADRLRDLLSRLACRGGATYLAVVDPGMLTIYPCVLSHETQTPDFTVIEEHSDSSRSFFQNLVQGSLKLNTRDLKVNEVHHVLLSALRTVSKALESSPAFRAREQNERFLEVLALTGRALFIRFLADRGILSRDTFSLLGEVAADDLLSTVDSAARTFAWLDQTFNGDLLPIDAAQGNYQHYLSEIHRVDRAVLGRLSQIMRHSADGQDMLWRYIDFAHVPVGLLSEVYEEFAHEHFGDSSRSESVHYTPRHIAELVVGQALDGLSDEQRASAKFIDPAVGAGVFLVVALKRLVLAHWEATGQRPDTAAIRALLYGQLRGLDINKSALLLAALSLYLTAIEVDADPLPPEKLRFASSLIGTVLFHVGEQDSLGTLGAGADRHVEYAADVVVGNPPWTSIKKNKDAFNRNAERIAERVMQERLIALDEGMRYENPDNVPDLPFLWRSMELCRPGGLIALLLHGRFLFAHRDKSAEARKLILKSIQVTGIVNGALLADSPLVWPKINAPFMMLFALNQPPTDDDVFLFVTPFEEPDIHRQGRIRIDPLQVSHISPAMLEESPSILKTLTRGTSLDTQVVNRIRKLTQADEDEQPQALPLGEYWDSLELNFGEGFRANGQGQKECSAISALNGLELKPGRHHKFLINNQLLAPFSRTSLGRRRNPEIYKPPLVLISEGPGEERESPKARVALGETPIVFNESFTGFSCSGHPEAEALAKYVFVVMNSSLPFYYQLMTSSKFGVERRAILVTDVTSFPIMNYSNVSRSDVDSIIKIADELCAKNLTDWHVLDELVFDIYGLSVLDREVIRDTLQMSSPWRHAPAAALEAPTDEAVQTFRAKLEKYVSALLNPNGVDIEVRYAEWQSRGGAWTFLEVSNRLRREGREEPTGIMRQLAQALADSEGASVIMLPLSEDYLVVGVLSQARYWTKSRARLMTHAVVQRWDEMQWQARESQRYAHNLYS